jgi:hypothetical protein
MNARAILPDGVVKPLLAIQDCDFNWQEEYWFAVPVFLPQGTRVEMKFAYDNSAANPGNPRRPPRRVTWGEQTTDEMAEVHLRLIPVGVPTDFPLHCCRRIVDAGRFTISSFIASGFSVRPRPPAGGGLEIFKHASRGMQ